MCAWLFPVVPLTLICRLSLPILLPLFQTLSHSRTIVYPLLWAFAFTPSTLLNVGSTSKDEQGSLSTTVRQDQDWSPSSPASHCPREVCETDRDPKARRSDLTSQSQYWSTHDDYSKDQHSHDQRPSLCDRRSGSGHRSQDLFTHRSSSGSSNYTTLAPHA